MTTLPADDVLIRETEELALAFLTRAEEVTTRAEKGRANRLDALLSDDAGRDLLLDLTDQVLRIRDPRRSAQRLHDLTGGSVPASLSPTDRLGLRVLGRIAPAIPRIAERAVDWRIDRDTAGVILPADDPAFADYLRARRRDGFRLNVNVLGESILGDDEAAERCRKVISLIERADVDYVSVKISALCANLDVLAESDSLRRIEARLREIYSTARDSWPRTFVNLDMEEYRDLELSLRSFMTVLDEPEFTDLEAGIVLQAYIPDSHAALERLCAWANARRGRGGAGIKVRLVKGANLAMEQVEAELHDWPQAPYPAKLDVDASFKRMLESALRLGNPDAVRVGVASHNLFEVAWAVTVCEHLGARDRLDVEMLEGMAPPQSRAVRDIVGGLLLYSPVVEKQDREASIAYLSRRLDENSSPENFLKSLFDITPGSPSWLLETERFRASVAARHSVSVESNRRQVRTCSMHAEPAGFDAAFVNCVDTDFTSEANRAWVESALTACEPVEPPLTDTVEVVDALVSAGLAAQATWAQTPWEQRRATLLAAADVMESERGNTLALMANTAGKTIAEGDPEISEAIDFTRYATHLTLGHEQQIADGLTWTPYRVIVVAGPWNFPYAIPASGLVHALAAGCAVIMKPAPETRAVAAALVDHLRTAGVPDGLVQLACTPDDEVGRHLITHDDVDKVMLTGSYDTATMFLEWKPALRINAETSGKNSLIITAAADIDQAIKDLVRSAFGHAGQKCSAASLGIVEASVYDDPSFHRRLADAVTSLKVGLPLDPATKVGPLIGPPGTSLRRALTTLEPGESWLVEPGPLDDGERLWSPGVRAGVAPGSWFHLTECFGPVLGIMRADSLEHAIELQNAPEYGLTGGVHTLDPKEIDLWLQRVQVGNAYVNRHITGAIVQRQPFGGWKRSSIGAGQKPGGPSHLHGYGTWSQGDADPARAGDSFASAWAAHFSRDNDPTALACEGNVLRYRPLDAVIVIAPVDADITRALALRAANTCGVSLIIVPEETEALRIASGMTPHFTRVRAPSGASADLRRRLQRLGIDVDDAPLTASGTVELPHWLLEQSISRTRHRYGRLIDRLDAQALTALDQRA
jgi:RHH-type proline utilization regulon transcriptional repressor/proline dehydrogenase/delta 1-pyrroline-5-carboxylate dehydrogenase